jgi:hypothetical protein
MPEDTLDEKIGYMRAEIKNVGKKLDGIEDKVDCIDTKVTTLTSTTVKQEECTKRTKAVTDAVQALTVEVQRKQTREENPAIGPLLKQQQEKKSWIQTAKDNAAAITTIITLLSLLGLGGYKFAHFIVRMEQVLEDRSDKTEKMLKSEIKKLDREPKIIHVKVPVYPDAGVPPRNRPRRRPR